MSHLCQNSQFHANVVYPNVYVRCTAVQIFTWFGSISDTNLTFDVTVTTNIGFWMNTVKFMYLSFSVFYAVQQSDDFVLLVALRPAGTHLPGPSEAFNTLTEVSCSQQRSKSCNKIPLIKYAILLINSYIHAS
jgi:hypothetical protein